jgi:prepilin-type N-terminal cleavage/methylation domain-containing protein
MNTFAPTRPRRKFRRAFTLVEIMVVVVIIGLIALLAIPAIQRVRQRAQNSRTASDLRTMAQAFEGYLLENGSWPPDAAPGAIPAGMAGRLPAAWNQPPAVGGLWEWDYEPATPLVSITLYAHTASLAQMTAIDALIDDGNPATGNFRINGSEWNYRLAP